MRHLFDSHFRQTAIYLGILLVVFGNTWILTTNFQRVSEQQRWVKHTGEVIATLENAYSSLVDAESSQRGYLMTRRPEFLAVFKRSMLQHEEQLTLLKGLMADNPVQSANLVGFTGAAQRRRQLLEANLDLYRDGVFKDASPLLEGRDLMEMARNSVGRMRIEEEQLLEERSRGVEQARNVFIASLVATTLLTLLGISIAFVLIRRAQKRLQDEAHLNAHRAWMRTNISDMAQVLAGETDMARAARQVLAQLGKQLGALGANLYMLDGDTLRLAGALAPEGGSSAPERVRADEGLLGEALRRPGIWEVTDVPPGYMRVGSSLGEAAPKSLLFFPICFQGEVLGLVEMAFFSPPSPEQRELLEAMLDPIATGVNAAVTRDRLKALLDETVQQAEELQAQQEELRAGNEELEQQARALEDQQFQLNVQNRELETSRQSLELKASELQRTNQYKSEFLAKMSHELRTPLNSLLILATLLMENKEGNLTEQQRSFAKSMHGAGEDLLNLINEILDLSKIEARKLGLRVEEFALGEVLDGMERTFQPQANAKGLVFKVDATPTDRAQALRTDRQRLEQVLRNFLSNALKFTEEGSITVSATFDGDQAILSVRDTGIGIPPHKRELVFEAFEQADGSISRRYGGTGLGLTISRELATLLGGSIGLESQEGEGSTFTLRIRARMDEPMPTPEPVKDSHASPPAHATASAPGEARLAAEALVRAIPEGAQAILVVEDDERFRHTVAETAKGYGFHPVEVGDGEVALEVLNLTVPKAILLDIKLPGISGMGLLEMVKQMPRLRHVPIHMISALEHQQNALRMGALGYLGKPVTIDKIRSALSRIEGLLKQKVKRLLVVEDDERQREAIIHLVSGTDVQVVSASTAGEALNVLKGEGADCVILDLSLPDLTGFELLDELDHLEVSLPPIVIYTGRDLSRQEEEALRRHSESIIIKGARSPERLLDEVNLFLHRVEENLPDEKRAMLTQLRTQEQVFEGKTALLVDDDMRNVFALTSALEAKGLNVRIARDGVEALEALEKYPEIDIVLMDIMMPRMDGYQAMRQIRANKRFAGLPIVALTAKAMREDHERCVEAGANDYLPKPINLPNLLSVMRVWLTREGVF